MYVLPTLTTDQKQLTFCPYPESLTSFTDALIDMGLEEDKSELLGELANLMLDNYDRDNELSVPRMLNFMRGYLAERQHAVLVEAIPEQHFAQIPLYNL